MNPAIGVRISAPQFPMNENNTEIERKYLLTGCPKFFLGRFKKTTLEGYIEQHWLPGDKIQERFRESGPLTVFGRPFSSEATWTRTIKLGSGLHRLEFEEDTTPEVFKATREICAARVAKWRYRVPVSAQVWEIDSLYDWRGYRLLWLAEVELSSIAEEVSIPSMLAPYIVREVTDCKEYTNRSLARERNYLADTQLDIFNLDKKVNLRLP